MYRGRGVARGKSSRVAQIVAIRQLEAAWKRLELKAGAVGGEHIDKDVAIGVARLYHFVKGIPRTCRAGELAHDGRGRPPAGRWSGRRDRSFLARLWRNSGARTHLIHLSVGCGCKRACPRGAYCIVCNFSSRRDRYHQDGPTSVSMKDLKKTQGARDTT